MLAGLALLSVVAVAAISDVDPSAFLLDESEQTEAAQVDKRPAAARKPGSPPVIRVLNAGAVDDDPQRHAIAVAAFERAASQPIDAVTDDDDFTPTGTYGDWYPPKLKSYRTVCVRLCDGALTPISFATTRDRLALDALRCRKSCNSPSKLYIQKNPATDTEALVDLDGKPYAQLATAFRFRTNYDDACTCRPHAWQGSARARHRMHEIQARLSSGRQIVKGRLAAIKVAVARSARVSVALASSGAGQDFVTGSAGKSSESPADADVASIDSSIGNALATAKLDRPKMSRKLSGKRKSRPIEIANAKAARALANNSAALLVLFGAAPDAGNKAANKLDSAVRMPSSLISVSAAARRYDGKDWRISIYEPM